MRLKGRTRERNREIRERGGGRVCDVCGEERWKEGWVCAWYLLAGRLCRYRDGNKRDRETETEVVRSRER
jgi:hypothetical protein